MRPYISEITGVSGLDLNDQSLAVVLKEQVTFVLIVSNLTQVGRNFERWDVHPITLTVQVVRDQKYIFS